MERTPISQDVVNYQKAKKAQILSSFKKGTDESDENLAKVITKAEFDEKYPADKFDYYTVETLTKFREDLIKAEDVEDKDGAFKKATSDLKPFVIHSEGKKLILFTREKQKGE